MKGDRGDMEIQDAIEADLLSLYVWTISVASLLPHGLA